MFLQHIHAIAQLEVQIAKQRLTSDSVLKANKQVFLIERWPNSTISEKELRHYRLQNNIVPYINK